MPSRILLACGLALGLSGTAFAADKTYVVRSFDEPASRGLPVSKPLDEFVATSRARALVPSTWKRRGTTQFDTPTGSNNCRYRVKFTVHSRVDDPGDATDRVTAAVPGSGAFVLDSGQRNGGAWRVVRKSKSGGIHVDAQWSGVLTRRKDIAPSGKVVWSDLSVTADSRAGSECHSGTYRQVLGPQIGDALATAKTSLRFLKKL